MCVVQKLRACAGGGGSGVGEVQQVLGNVQVGEWGGGGRRAVWEGGSGGKVQSEGVPGCVVGAGGNWVGDAQGVG